MLMQMDFEGQWAMLMGILPDGAGAADMLCRILVAIDEDIVSLDIPRSPDGIKASMEFKVNGHVITMHMCVISHIPACPCVVNGARLTNSRTAIAGVADKRYDASRSTPPFCSPVAALLHCKHTHGLLFRSPVSAARGRHPKRPCLRCPALPAAL